MTPVHDKFSRDVYQFLEDKKKVDKLTGYDVKFEKRKGRVALMRVTLTFSSINTSDILLKEMMEFCNTSLKEHTDGLLYFIPSDIKKSVKPIPASAVSSLELSAMWEQFNSDKYVPKEKFFNHFVVEMSIRKG